MSGEGRLERGFELAHRRQEAIDTLLRLMGCTDARTSNCEHVAAVASLSSAMVESTAIELDRACGGALRDAGLLDALRLETYIRPGVTGRREGTLR